MLFLAFCLTNCSINFLDFDLDEDFVLDSIDDEDNIDGDRPDLAYGAKGRFNLSYFFPCNSFLIKLDGSESESESQDGSTTKKTTDQNPTEPEV